MKHFQLRQLLALQLAETSEALGADPGDHRKLKSMRALQIFDSEEACIRQSPRTGKRQSSTLPCLGSTPVLRE